MASAEGQPPFEGCDRLFGRSGPSHERLSRLNRPLAKSFSMIVAPFRSVIFAPGQRLTAAAKVALANRRSFTPALVEIRAGGVTGDAYGFFILSQSGERPDR